MGRLITQAAAALLCASVSGCSAFVALLAPPAPTIENFVIVTRRLAWTGPLTSLTERANVGLSQQGAQLQSAAVDRAKYKLELAEQSASLVLRKTAAGVSLKVVAIGPYSGELALRVSACTKILRRAAAEAAQADLTTSGADAPSLSGDTSGLPDTQ